MANMTHCRFENTYQDLKDCQEALDEAGGIEEVQAEANQYERKYVRKLVALCREIADEYGQGEDEEED